MKLFRIVFVLTLVMKIIIVCDYSIIRYLLRSLGPPNRPINRTSHFFNTSFILWTIPMFSLYTLYTSWLPINNKSQDPVVLRFTSCQVPRTFYQQTADNSWHVVESDMSRQDWARHVTSVTTICRVSERVVAGGGGGMSHLTFMTTYCPQPRQLFVLLSPDIVTWQ